jgi:hypothetical protein
LGVLFPPSLAIALLSFDLSLLCFGELSAFVLRFVAGGLILDDLCDLLSVDGLTVIGWEGRGCMDGGLMLMQVFYLLLYALVFLLIGQGGIVILLELSLDVDVPLLFTRLQMGIGSIQLGKIEVFG